MVTRYQAPSIYTSSGPEPLITSCILANDTRIG